jgi:hypothetical protein
MTGSIRTPGPDPGKGFKALQIDLHVKSELT